MANVAIAIGRTVEQAPVDRAIGRPKRADQPTAVNAAKTRTSGATLARENSEQQSVASTPPKRRIAVWGRLTKRDA